MKKFTYLFCLFILCSAFTCENEPLDGDFVLEDNNPDNQANGSLVGTWTLVSMEADIATSTVFQGIDFSVAFTAEVTDSDYTLVFAEDSYTVSGDYEMTITSTFDGVTETYTDSYTNVTGGGNYSTNGNVMTVDGQFFEFDFEGAPTDVASGEQTAEFQLSNNGQTLTFFQDETITENEAGFEATVTTVSTSVWQKVE